MFDEIETGRAKRALAVAKDVLEQLDRQDLPLNTESRKGYVYGNLSFLNNSLEDDLQNHADKLQETCTVCALGACLLSAARVYDQIPVKNVIDSPSEVDPNNYFISHNLIISALENIFSGQTCTLIEAAFEQSYMLLNFTETVSIEQLRGAAAFGCRYNSDEERLRGIMENVVENEGNFLVPELTHAKFVRVISETDGCLP